ncbi:MAG: hypothetical protein HPY83_15350 [Anaerolineae bacterium]|nr:hypothetical protein [Anaerolineae bacterium]
MSEYIVPTENLIAFRRGAPRSHTEPIARASVAQVRAENPGLTVQGFVLLGCATALLAAVGVLYLLQAAEITSIAYRVHDLSAEVRRLEQENSVLAVEIAALERLDRVEHRAEALGFSRAGAVHYLRLEASETPVPQSVTPVP